MTQRGRSDTPRWWKVIAADLVAVVVITAAVEATRASVLVALLGLPVGALVFRRWAP